MPYTGSRKDAERRRRRAMALLDQGWTQKQVAAELGVTPAAVCQWVKARRDGGDAALAARPHPGRKPKLDARQRRQLQKMLLRGPRQNGYANDLWTLPRIAELIQRRFRRDLRSLGRLARDASDGLVGAEAATPGARTRRPSGRAVTQAGLAADKKTLDAAADHRLCR